VLEKKPGADVALQGRDKLTVYNRSAFRDPPKATISGEVRMTRQPPGQPPKAEGPFPADKGRRNRSRRRVRSRPGRAGETD